MRPHALLLALTLATAPGRALAGDAAAAEELFQQGREALRRGDYADACAKLDESQRLDPAAGTILNLGDCKEHLGLFASAWALYKEVADRASSGEAKRAEAQRRLAAIEPRLSHLSVALARGAPEGAAITRDGVELRGASLGIPLPVDPGAHVVVARAPGHAPRQTTVHLAEAESRAVTLEVGPVEESAGSTRTLGFVLGGVGIAGIAVGVATGLMTLDRKNTVESLCPDKRCATRAGLDAASQGKTLSLASTLAFAGGAAALGLGAVFVLTSPSEAHTTSVSAGVGPGSLGVRLLQVF
jgi:hypothetical protein